jgi:hypothetical protein
MKNHDEYSSECHTRRDCKALARILEGSIIGQGLAKIGLAR